MAKRFTESGKWDDPFFGDLTPEGKLLWVYVCDRCDIAGVWEPSQRLVAFHLGMTADLSAARAWFGDRVELLADGKWRLVKFLKFQYPNGLNPQHRMHQPIIARLKAHGLPVPFIDTQVSVGRDSPETHLSLQDKEQDSLPLHISSFGGGSKGEPTKDLVGRSTFVKWLLRSTLAATDEGLIEQWIGIAIKAGAPRDTDGPIDWGLRIDRVRRCCAAAKRVNGKCSFPSHAEPFAKQIKEQSTKREAS